MTSLPYRIITAEPSDIHQTFIRYLMQHQISDECLMRHQISDECLMNVLSHGFVLLYMVYDATHVFAHTSGIIVLHHNHLVVHISNQVWCNGQDWCKEAW